MLVCFAVWTAVSALLGEQRRFFPWPWQVLAELLRTLVTAECWIDVMGTLSRTVVAFTVGTLLGGPIGILLGYRHSWYEAARVPIDFMRSVPIPALFPVAMLFFGIGDTAKIVSVAVGCGLIVLVNSAGAVRNTPEIYKYLGQILSLSRRERFWKVTLPAALPEIANGLRVAVSVTLILVVVLEMFVGSSKGLGLRLYNDQQIFRIKDMYASLLMIGGLGYFANVGLAYLQERFVHWSGK
jgi:NitT/TauT family transport system permease protein